MNNPRKQVLIVGANSYIGTRFATYSAAQFDITCICARNQNWDSVDMSGFDSVLHVAGIAHKKQTHQLKTQYFQVNRDLVETVAKKAKDDGVRQFIFISTMAVHSAKPDDFYAHSKLQAEKLLDKLREDDFQVAVVRPPMVYGPGCKGNFTKLAALIRRTLIFPKIKNARSMIYIDNLCAFLCQIIETDLGGLFHPQNKAYNCTTQMVQLIAKYQRKKIYTTRLFNWLIYLLMPFISTLEKLFASYEHPFKGDEANYHVVDYEESIRVSICTSSSNE